MKFWETTIIVAGVFLFAGVSAARADAPAAEHVGALEYIEGSVFVDGQAIAPNQENLPILNEGSILRTAKGHAEMLLTPGIFLRLDEQSEVRLTAAGLADTAVRLNRGAAMLEVDEIHKDNLIQVWVGAESARVLKTGLYRFDAQPGAVEVQQGEAAVTEGNRTVKVHKNHEALVADFRTAKLRGEEDDNLSRWSRLRSEYEAEASVSSAQYVYDMGMPWGFSNWFWNPWFDSWAWLPASGGFINPYGFGYWSPWLVYDYYPMRYYGRSHVAFVPNAGRMNVRGPDVRRGGAMLRAARSGAMPSRGFSARSASGGMRSFGGTRSFGGGLTMRPMGGGFRGRR